MIKISKTDQEKTDNDVAFSSFTQSVETLDLRWKNYQEIFTNKANKFTFVLQAADGKIRPYYG